MRIEVVILAGLMAHIIADWFFQNDWMAVNKTNWKHPAGYIHAGIHFFLLSGAFPVTLAALLGISHFIIDLRFPLEWWRRFMGQALPGNPFIDQIKIWQDQAAHVLCIMIAATFYN